MTILTYTRKLLLLSGQYDSTAFLTVEDLMAINLVRVLGKVLAPMLVVRLFICSNCYLNLADSHSTSERPSLVQPTLLMSSTD